MRSRLILLIFLSAMMLGYSNAQNTTIKADSRLYECYDSTYIQQIQSSNPPLVAYYNFYLDNSYTVTSLTQPKPVTGEDINKVTVIKEIAKEKIIYFGEKTYDAKTFNVLKYNFKTQDLNFTTYVWKDAGIAVVFKPRDKIAAAFKEYCRKNNIQNK
jgi:hypothetical protein